MYNFLLIQWKMNKIDEVYLQDMVAKERITQAEYEKIVNTLKV